ncbi:MAG: hypothetical protein ACNS61_15220 [Candidatus Wenzhouxiangella sp. M2_3B_020]
MSRFPEVLPNFRSVRIAVLFLIAGAPALAIPSGAVAQSSDAGTEAAPAASTPAPLPTREQILSDPFLRNALSRSTEGLEVVRRSDGAVKLDLQGRFQSISTARIDSEGGVEVGCAETHDSLADFLAAHPSPAEPVGAGDADEPDDAHE